MRSHHYFAFGLRVESSWPIPSLVVPAFPFSDRPDVEIVEGEVPVPASPRDLDGMKVNFERDSHFLDIEECGRFQIIGGRKIVVQADPKATSDQVNLYLLGSVFGALLHQRGMLPFHCNAVEIRGSAFLFCGDSGAGKSTLAAHFVERGFRLLSDDLCALQFAGDGRLVACPGIARLKLWRDTLELFGRSSADLTLVPWHYDKFEVPLKRGNCEKPLTVAGIYHLRRAEGRRPPGIHPLKGLEAANSITSNIYRRRLADLTGTGPFYLTATGRIIDQVPIFTVNRKWGLDYFREDALATEHHMHALVNGLA